MKTNKQKIKKFKKSYVLLSTANKIEGQTGSVFTVHLEDMHVTG